MSSGFQQMLGQGLERMGIIVDQAGRQRLENYFLELRKWSRKVNLIAKQTSDEQLVENHFLDSLALLPYLQKTGQPRLLDIGSGAGFPGLVCKAAFPELSLVLVEPRLKRANFLRHMTRHLGLNEVEVLCSRIEDEGALPSSEVFSHITCRAVAELRIVLDMALRFSSGNPKLAYLKGPKWREELDAAQKEPAISAFRLAETAEYKLPFSGAARTLMFFYVGNEG